jgi:hypothetical protein
MCGQLLTGVHRYCIYPDKRTGQNVQKNAGYLSYIVLAGKDMCVGGFNFRTIDTLDGRY